MDLVCAFNLKILDFQRPTIRTFDFIHNFINYDFQLLLREDSLDITDATVFLQLFFVRLYETVSVPFLHNQDKRHLL